MCVDLHEVGPVAHSPSDGYLHFFRVEVVLGDYATERVEDAYVLEPANICLDDEFLVQHENVCPELNCAVRSEKGGVFRCVL